MKRQIYAAIELDHERLGRFTFSGDGEPRPDDLLDYLAGDDEASHRAAARELESFLWQRQSHVLGRADCL